MTVLVDTSICTRILKGDLAPESQAVLESADEVFYSEASLWEISVKHGLGRIAYGAQEAFDGLSQSGISRVRTEVRDFTALESLPAIHQDPFDRFLIAQAISRGMTFLTTDDALASYGPVVKILTL
jgi:PIN domain nuclease of toxin-antitoxin system